MGDGSTLVVLVNSIGLSVRMWQPQLNAFPEGVQLIAYDQRGHGRSVGLEPPSSLDDLTDDLMAVLDKEGADTAMVCGLSLGGMVGIRAAARYPDRVDRLVLASTSAVPGDPLKWQDRADLVRTRGMEAFVARTKRGWFTPGFSRVAWSTGAPTRGRPSVGRTGKLRRLLRHHPGSRPEQRPRAHRGPHTYHRRR